jgi:teichuronic acid biosynthesis protein TuaE
MHSVLRLSPESSFSLYRFLMPVSLLLFIIYIKNHLKIFFYFLFFIFYNFIIALIYSNNLNFYIIQTLHHISILNIFFIIYYLIKRVDYYNIYKFLKFFALFSIILAIFQIIFNFNLPNTAKYFDGSVSAFNWNQNELGTALLAFVPLLLVFERNNIFKYIFLSFLILILYINDSKLSLIGLFIALFFYFLKKNILEFNKYLKLSVIVLIPLILLLLPYDEIIIPFRDYDVSLGELLFEPLKQISNLQPFQDSAGSIASRANAIIFSIIEFKNSYFLGIGSGNSLLMLEKSEYILKSAKSMHNLPFQLIVEHGIFILVLFILVFLYFIRFLYKQNLTKIELLKFITIPSVFIGSMGSSIGVFSNYFFICCLFFIILLNPKETYY